MTASPAPDADAGTVDLLVDLGAAGLFVFGFIAGAVAVVLVVRSFTDTTRRPRRDDDATR